MSNPADSTRDYIDEIVDKGATKESTTEDTNDE
jgi:hypothetical protein